MDVAKRTGGPRPGVPKRPTTCQDIAKITKMLKTGGKRDNSNKRETEGEQLGLRLFARASPKTVLLLFVNGRNVNFVEQHNS
jgi:hypothetical protein